MTFPNPLVGIYCTVSRKTQSGLIVGENQRVSLLQAIRAFTWSGAYASFEEEQKGSIEAGKLADLVVLNGSILNSEPEGIPSLRANLTMIDGEIVYKQ